MNLEITNPDPLTAEIKVGVEGAEGALSTQEFRGLIRTVMELKNPGDIKVGDPETQKVNDGLPLEITLADNTLTIKAKEAQVLASAIAAIREKVEEVRKKREAEENDGAVAEEVGEIIERALPGVRVIVAKEDLK